MLGVVSFMAHVGQHLRRRLAALVPAVPLKRLSYAGVALGSAITLTIALALCGVHLVP
jgi:hypothetical protein